MSTVVISEILCIPTIEPKCAASKKTHTHTHTPHVLIILIEWWSSDHSISSVQRIQSFKAHHQIQTMSDEIESNRDSVSSTASGMADLCLNQPTATSKPGENKEKAKAKKGMISRSRRTMSSVLHICWTNRILSLLQWIFYSIPPEMFRSWKQGNGPLNRTNQLARSFDSYTNTWNWTPKRNWYVCQCIYREPHKALRPPFGPWSDRAESFDGLMTSRPFAFRFSFCMWIKRSHRRPIKRSKTSTTATERTANWYYIIARVKHGARSSHTSIITSSSSASPHCCASSNHNEHKNNTIYILLCIYVMYGLNE